ncbi:MAG: trypsin-like peptidase domain-containing protein [Firmicutes bacterium]|nr:trypsin-like peptidase domain-containing protein [Bacillota bacterium]
MKDAKTQLTAIILAALIAFGFGLGGGVAGIYLLQNGYITLPQAKVESTSAADGSLGFTAPAPGSSQQIITVSENSTIAEAIAEKVLPSVVGISTTYAQADGYSGLGGLGNFWNWGFGYGPQTYESTAIGTGVIVDSRGYILTNSHVINDGEYTSILVNLYDGSDVEGTVLWNDSTLDLAVVKIDRTDLIAAELGDSDQLKIGSYAAAIGNPLGLEFERSMSQGIISGKERVIEVGTASSSTTMEGLLQTDATINSGNSGGPLLNSRGEVIGINTAKASDGEGMGFAIPINVAKPIVEQIIQTGRFERAYIGISGGALEETSYASQDLIDHFGTDKGIYVSNVSEGGGAEAAGIQEGDIIIRLNGTTVNTMNKLNSLLVRFLPGDSVTLTVLRKGETLEIDVTLTNGMIFDTQKN